ncbi:Elicitor-like transglutaminase, partial [Globisporangium splendens]
MSWSDDTRSAMHLRTLSEIWCCGEVTIGLSATRDGARRAEKLIWHYVRRSTHAAKVDSFEKQRQEADDMVSFKLIIGYLLALSSTTVLGGPIDHNPTTNGEHARLSHGNFAGAGFPVSSNVAAYSVRDGNVSLTTPNGSNDGNASVPLATVAASHMRTRNLADAYTDLDRLEDYFGMKMERNLETLMKPEFSSASFDPAPWPGSYWPIYADGINYRWQGDQEPSAAEKYAAAFGLDVKQFTDAISYSTGILSQSYRKVCTTSEDCHDQNDGSICGIRFRESSGYCIPGWFGICHAWAPAAILEKEPRCAVKKGNVIFQAFDIKGLLTQIYDGANTETVFTGARFNGPDEPTEMDEYGRFVDLARRDLGPGFFHITIANILGKFKKSFVVDVTAGAEVWNQPVRGYEVESITVLSTADGAREFFGKDVYPFNADAKKLAYVSTTLSWINEAGEDGSLVENGHANWYTAYRTYEYVLELDAKNQIIGGEWVGESKTNHPDFLWFPGSRPDPSTITSVGLSSFAISNDDCAISNDHCASSSAYYDVVLRCDRSPPWDPWFYQCRSVPTKCGKQQTGTDFYGDDLTAIYGLSLPEECCDKCTSTAGCKAYTFVNYNSDGRTACYLKTGSGDKREVVGAVSAIVVSEPATISPDRPSGQCGSQQTGIDFYGDDIESVYIASADQCCAQCADTAGCKAYTFIPADHACYLKSGVGSKRSVAGAISAQVTNPRLSTSTCSTSAWGRCGDSNGAKCCPSGFYCQPWNPMEYQCIPEPTQCSRQFTDVDFYGNDLSVVYVFLPSECCARCADTPGCKAYTFRNDNPGYPACYLKSSSSGKIASTGAVSGLLN